MTTFAHYRSPALLAATTSRPFKRWNIPTAIALHALLLAGLYTAFTTQPPAPAAPATPAMIVVSLQRAAPSMPTAAAPVIQPDVKQAPKARTSAAATRITQDAQMKAAPLTSVSSKILPPVMQRKVILTPPAPAPHTASPASGQHRSTTPAAAIPITRHVQYRSPPAAPAYPARSIRLGQQGTTVIQALVAASGTTQQLRITRSSGHYLLDEAVIAAAKHWQYQPATRSGTPITSWIERPVEFRLQ